MGQKHRWQLGLVTGFRGTGGAVGGAVLWDQALDLWALTLSPAISVRTELNCRTPLLVLQKIAWWWWWELLPTPHPHTNVANCAQDPRVRPFCDPVDCSPPGSFVCRIPQARILEWVASALLQGIFPTQGLNPSLLCLHHPIISHLYLAPPQSPAVLCGTPHIHTCTSIPLQSFPSCYSAIVSRALINEIDVLFNLWIILKALWKLAAQ